MALTAHIHYMYAYTHMYMSLKVMSKDSTTAYLPSLTKGRLGQGGWLRGLTTYSRG